MARWGYLIFFLAGAVLGGDDRLRVAVCRDAPLAGAVGGAIFAGGLVVFLAADAAAVDAFTDADATAVAFRVLFGAAGWLFVVAIFGGLDRRALRRAAAVPPGADQVPGAAPGAGARAYAYLLAAALPLYVLHQSVVVGVAALVVPWRAPIVVELLVVVAASAAVLLVVYDLGVRRWRVTRRAFGMRP